MTAAYFIDLEGYLLLFTINDTYTESLESKLWELGNFATTLQLGTRQPGNFG